MKPLDKRRATAYRTATGGAMAEHEPAMEIRTDEARDGTQWQQYRVVCPCGLATRWYYREGLPDMVAEANLIYGRPCHV